MIIDQKDIALNIELCWILANALNILFRAFVFYKTS